MGNEIDLLVNYPKSKRDVSSRANEKTDADREIARKFDKAFFDGEEGMGMEDLIIILGLEASYSDI